MNVNGRTVLVTGGSRGLGRALVTTLLNDGWAVITDARDGRALDALTAAHPETAQLRAIEGDIENAGHRRVLAEAARQMGGLDLLVNNAGTLGPSPLPPLLDFPLSGLEDAFRINVVAQLGLIQALREEFKPGATIINVTSDAAVEAYPGWGGYGASKAALEQMSAVLAAENPDLRVYWLDPGDMRTRMHQDAFPGEDIGDRPLPDEVVPAIMRLIASAPPSGRHRAAAFMPAEIS